MRPGVPRLIALLSLATLAPPAPAGTPTIQTDAYASPSVGRTLKCKVVLPADYDATDKRYPVLYLLHGFSGDYTKWSNLGAAKAAEPYDLIVVSADAGNSWYVNWAESEGGQKNDWEDAIVKDLVGHVDATYRTVASREGRAINGLSMGGYGALVLGLRHPDLFCSIGSHSGAVDLARSISRQLEKNPEAVLPDRKPEAKANPAIGLEDFDSQEERTPHGRIFATVAQCDAHDPFRLVRDVPREEMPHIHVDCGTEDPFIGHNQEFLRLLMDEKLPFTYAQSPGGHRSAYWSRELGHSMAIQYHILRRNIAEKAGASASPAKATAP